VHLVHPVQVNTPGTAGAANRGHFYDILFIKKQFGLFTGIHPVFLKI
jgi:hypothetical protein